MPIYNMYKPPRNNECYIIKAEKKTGLKYVGIIDKGSNDYFYTLNSYRKPNDPTKRVFSKCGFKTYNKMHAIFGDSGWNFCPYCGAEMEPADG